MKLEFSRQIFEKYSNVNFYENPFSGNRAVLRGREARRTDREVDLTKLSGFSQF
jgi:hypothetical protein